MFDEAKQHGIIEDHQRMEKYGPNSTQRFEQIVTGGPTGVRHPQTLQPTTVKDWAEDAKRRNVVPYIPNQEPRVPAGSPEGGQWTKVGNTGGRADVQTVCAPNGKCSDASPRAFADTHGSESEKGKA